MYGKGLNEFAHGDFDTMRTTYNAKNHYPSLKSKPIKNVATPERFLYRLNNSQPQNFTGAPKGRKLQPYIRSTSLWEKGSWVAPTSPAWQLAKSVADAEIKALKKVAHEPIEDRDAAANKVPFIGGGLKVIPTLT